MRKELLHRSHAISIATRIGDCQDEPNRKLVTLCELLPLELSCPELRLQVDQHAFDFDVDELIRPPKDDVGGAPVTGPDRHLELGRP